MIELLLVFFGEYLIECMTFMITIALVFRWISFTHSKRDEGYFSHFTRELSSTIDEDKARSTIFSDIDDYLEDLLGRVNQKLPERNLRKEMGGGRRKTDTSNRRSVSLNEYMGSKHGLISNIQNESSVFKTSVPPEFSELTERILNDDENWSKMFGIIPIDGVTRMLSVLPTLFIILGVFGTFIGISMALPEIAKMDFNNLEASGKTLSLFVLNVTFAMKTSIAGIFFSIILTLLNTLFPVDATRERTFEKVENVLQALWYHLQTDSKTNTQEEETRLMRETMQAILKELQSKDNPKVKKAA